MSSARVMSTERGGLLLPAAAAGVVNLHGEHAMFPYTHGNRVKSSDMLSEVIRETLKDLI